MLPLRYIGMLSLQFLLVIISVLIVKKAITNSDSFYILLYTQATWRCVFQDDWAVHDHTSPQGWFRSALCCVIDFDNRI